MSRRVSILLTLLERDQGLAQALGTEISRLGADCTAHFWTEPADAQTLAQLFQEVLKPDLGAWIIAGENKSLTPAVLSGLSLTALAVQHARLQEDRPGLPMILSPSGGLLPTLPTPLADCAQVTRSVGAKAIAMAHTPRKLAPRPYRLNVLPLHGLGLWLECGPAQAPWEGALLGSRGAEPDAHGVGQAGVIPQRSTLRHPVRGMKIAASTGEFTAWGTGNTLDCGSSYFVRLNALPQALLLGPFPTEDKPELFVVDLCQN